MNKYDWSNVPKDVNWIATDGSGRTHAFYVKPKIDLISREWINMYPSTYFVIGRILHQGDWRESLEERPNE